MGQDVGAVILPASLILGNAYKIEGVAVIAAKPGSLPPPRLRRVSIWVTYSARTAVSTTVRIVL